MVRPGELLYDSIGHIRRGRAAAEVGCARADFDPPWRDATVGIPPMCDFVADPYTGIAGAFRGTNTLKKVRRLLMPRYHDVRAEDVDLKRLGALLAVAYERGPKSFADLLLVQDLGPRTLRTLAMVADTVHGTPVRFSDPARFFFALGGTDGHPFSVPLKSASSEQSVGHCCVRMGAGSSARAAGERRIARTQLLCS